MKRFVLFLTFLSTILPVSAYENKNGLWYAGDYLSGCADTCTVVVIPDGVTGIKAGCFSYHDNLKTVYIPESVRNIEAEAFLGCKNLTTVNFLKSTYWRPFDKIGDRAFADCKALTSFSTDGGHIYDLGDKVFYGCSCLSSVSFSSSRLGSQVFAECPNLESADLNVHEIGSYNFLNCEKLKDVTLSNVTFIKGTNFKGCPSLKSINLNETTPYYFSDGLIYYSNGTITECLEGTEGELTIPDTFKTISAEAFSGCKKLTSVTIPSSVTEIQKGAFDGCSGLTSVSIPASIEAIEDFTFSGCSSLTSVTIPNSVKHIGESAFQGCSSLTSVFIPNSVKAFYSEAFGGCTSLTDIVIPNSVVSLSSYAFKGCKSLSSVSLSTSLTGLNANVFENCSSLTSLTIPNSIIYGVGGTLANCTNLTTLYIPDLSGEVWLDLSDCVKLQNVYCDYDFETPKNHFLNTIRLNSLPSTCTLHVREHLVDAYKALDWCQGINVVALREGEMPITEQCATPTIRMQQGAFVFDCETEGVEYVSHIRLHLSQDEGHFDSQVKLSNLLTLYVYATKQGMKDSETASMTLSIPDYNAMSCDINGDGKVTAADITEVVNAAMAEE